VLKPNGGQASALKAGLTASCGDIVIFLDADDVLLPTAVDRALQLFASDDVVKVHWPLWLIDGEGHRSGAKQLPSLCTCGPRMKALMILPKFLRRVEITRIPANRGQGRQDH
jgi:cellulose synthase/poly-beta-1,6-N-acetylglucosamine synthase-like glycosyltransferase